jgi:hypothetical protein
VRATVSGGSCTYRYDFDATFTQSGNSISGPAQTTFRSIDCGVPGLDQLIGNLSVPNGSFTFSATLSPPSGISIPLGVTPLTGTYTATTIQATGGSAQPGGTLDTILNITKR